ncbi:extracellular solute-binding protein [Paracoccaceae bacterium]|jgi:ABC-type glycerol-3-phosphate transport system substrate-binding protein|nr:extracellular solute-binding protein [Paracoccaceae bacterium]|tara:strand:+ start:339 stop:1580 length:1242 start_codon:yes stop_codon:yes gene_type:complete
MIKNIMRLVVASAIAVFAAPIFADGHGCKISARVSIVGNEFPAIHAVADGAKVCKGSEVKANLTADHQKINVAGMSGNPAEYTSAIIANSSIVALMNNDVIRPLDDLVAKHGKGLKKNQLITINGKVMAVAFMANAQHLVYRSDILEKAGISAPKTYEEMLAGAKIIKDKGLMDYPLGGAYKAGWNLAQEFTNMYIGHGGEFFKSGSAEVSINNAKGVATLEMLKALSAYMNPDFLTHDSNATSAEWKAGNVAMMNMWGSRMGPLMDPEQSTPTVVKTTTLGDPMTVGGGSTPATTLWWDGWTVAKNISDAEAEATFIAMMNGINPKRLDDKMMPLAVWLIEGFKPGPANVGVAAAARMNAIPYPMLPYQGLLHSALGSEIVDFMQGKEDAATALADVEAAYTAAAKEKGFLN